MPDLAVGLLRHGYGALAMDRRRRGAGRSYESRLLARRAVVVGGAEGARLFYDEELVERSGAVPPPLAWLLFGKGAVHGLDAEQHRERKQLFTALLAPGQVASCAATGQQILTDALDRSAGGEVEVFSQLVSAYGRAVFSWAGIDVPRSDAEGLSREFASIVDGFGFAGAAYLRAWRARQTTNGWARRYLAGIRRGQVAARGGTVVQAIADSDLDVSTAAVELGNVLRPTIAVAWLGTFAVLALDRFPHWRPSLADPAREAERVSFANEVRRTAPFVPALAGRVRRDRTHDGLRLRRGDRIVLDVRGINHDERVYGQPEYFRPERFLTHAPDPYSLVPQGGGPLEGHRCPGESMAVQLLSATTQVFAGREYDVVSDPVADLNRIPTLPAQGLRIRLSTEEHRPR